MTICQKVIIESQLQFTYNVWFELLWNIRYNICCWLGESHSSSLPRYGPHYQNEGSTYHETWFKGLKDIPTLYFSTPSFNPGPFNPRLFKYKFLNHGVEKLMVEKSGVEMSFNRLRSLENWLKQNVWKVIYYVPLLDVLWLQ